MTDDTDCSNEKDGREDTSFTLLPNLPKELRDDIWDWAMIDNYPRIIRIRKLENERSATYRIDPA